jgi:hypothetical protein
VGSTGEFSIYTEFQGNEIMFHVSTLLPYSAADLQKVISKGPFISSLTFLLLRLKESGISAMTL